MHNSDTLILLSRLLFWTRTYPCQMFLPISLKCGILTSNQKPFHHHPEPVLCTWSPVFHALASSSVSTLSALFWHLIDNSYWQHFVPNTSFQIECVLTCNSFKGYKSYSDSPTIHKYNIQNINYITTKFNTNLKTAIIYLLLMNLNKSIHIHVNRLKLYSIRFIISAAVRTYNNLFLKTNEIHL